MTYFMKLTGMMAIAVIFLVTTGCATAPATVQGKADIRAEADAALSKARFTDPTIVGILSRSAGYAVFPSIGKGGLGVGGAYGKGVLYSNGRAVGYCDLTQTSIGAQVGGQSYSEIICFETWDSVETFKQGNYRFNAQATAVALKSGAGENAKFRDGVAVFTMDETGLMLEASVGGQKFSYQEI
jgi:lipid-binding SYLF domain-containing protein